MAADLVAQDTHIGEKPVPATLIIVTGAYLVAEAMILLYALWAFFPPSAPAGAQAPASSDFSFFGGVMTLTRERDFLVTVAIAGALGAMAYVIRSFIKYVGERNLLFSWLPLYILTPLVGAVLATVVYVVIRAGLISGGGADQTNSFGVAAVGVLVGLFSAQAAEKLKQVFEALFAVAPKGKDRVAEPEKKEGDTTKG